MSARGGHTHGAALQGCRRLAMAWPMILAITTLPAAAHAHTGAPVTSAGAWRAWSLEPLVLIGLGLAAFAWARGVDQTWRRAGTGRVFDAFAVRAGAAGVVTLVVALVSPVDAVGSALFAGHMVQHLLLIAVAAPLLVRGDFMGGAFRALPVRARRRVARAARRSGALVVWRTLRAPLIAWIAHAAILWLWHLPRPYDAALQHDAVHALEHATMLVSALLFWLAVLRPQGRRQRLPDGAAILYLFAFGMQASLLGALLTLADSPWYDGHLAGSAAWGLTPLQDQHLAGAIMWVPGGALYLAAVARVFLGWLRRLEERSPSAAVVARGTR